MKTNTLKTVFGGAMIAGTILLAPITAFALDTHATSSSSVRINQDGFIRVVNAEVTSIAGNLVNAVTRFRNNVMSWAFTTNATTTIAANNQLSTSTTVLQVGDRINVSGTLTSLVGSTASVAVIKIKEPSSMPKMKPISGTVQSVQTTNGTFVLNANNKMITVQTNASTIWKGATTTLATLATNSKIAVIGTSNVDGAMLTATHIVVKTENDKQSSKKDNRWKNKENGNHYGFLKAKFGFDNNR